MPGPVSPRLAAVVLAWAVVVAGVGVVAAVAGDGDDRPEGRGNGQVSSVAVDDLHPGQCLAEVPGGSRIVATPVVPCDEPHRAEVIADVAVPGGRFPGAETLAATAYERCSQELAGYVGVPEIRTPFDTGFLTPSAPGWAVGDRTITCVVALPVAGTGSVRGIDLSSGWAGRHAPAGMAPGHCIAAGETLPAEVVTLTDCRRAHAYELFAVRHLDDAEMPAFPGTAAMHEIAGRFCVEQFEHYVGRPYDGAGLPVTLLYPTEDTWPLGARTIACFVDSGGAAGSVAAAR